MTSKETDGQWRRRRVLQLFGASSLAATGLTRLAGRSAAATADTWTQFGYDRANTGYAPYNSGPVADLTQEWSVQTGDAVRSSPAVADGTVYIGSNDGYLYALDAATGEQRWRHRALEEVSSTPAIADGTLFVTSFDSRLYALDAGSGDERWRFEIDKSMDSSPTVVDDTVYVGDWDGVVYAIDAETGDEQWQFDSGDRRMRTAPAVVNGTVYGVSAGRPGEAYALDAATGDKKWGFETGIKFYSSPAVANGTVFFGSDDDFLYALDAADGTELWSVETGPIWFSSPAVADGTVYVGSGKTVYAIDATSGDTRWTVQTDTTVSSSPAVVVGTVYVGTEGGTLYALDAADGTSRWAGQVGGALRTSPTVAGGTIYLGSEDHSVYALGGVTKTPARTPPPTPTATVSTTAAPTTTMSVPSETGTSTPASTSSQDDGGLSVGLFSAGAVLGALGLGGGGTLWWLKRDSDGDTSGVEPAPDDDPGTDDSATGTATGGRPSTSAARGIPDTIPDAPDVSVDYDALTDQQVIGTGGTADVTEATLPTPAGDVQLAIKQPRLSGTLSDDVVDRLLKEAETWDKLDDSDHVVGLVDYGSRPIPWIAMEYMDGGHLGTRAEEMSFQQKLWTAIAITNGVHHAHRRGVAHLDLKPENVLFRRVDDAWDVPKVSDWGFSKHLLERPADAAGFSPPYAAPEQFDDDRGPADDVTDVYQLGAVFYELFTGRPPFEGQPTSVMRAVMQDVPTPPSELADLPTELDAILSTALAKDRHERYESVLVLRNALQNLDASDP